MKTLLKFAFWTFVFVLCSALFFNWVFFSPRKPNITLSQIDKNFAAGAIASLAKTAQNEFSTILNLKDRDRSDIREMSISSGELNSIFNAYLIGNQIVEREDEAFKITSATFKDGVLYVNLTLVCKFYTPFGSFINVAADVIPAIDKGFLRVTVKRLKVGRLELKPLNSTFSKHKNELRLDPVIEKVLASIDKLESRKDGILIQYYPDKLQGLFAGAINSAFQERQVKRPIL